MNATPSSTPGFLAALAPIIRLQGSSIEIDEEDGELHVVIAVEGHDVMSASGPAASLDAQLPAAIEKFANWISASAAKKGGIKIDFPRAMAAQHTKAQPAPRRARKKVVAKKKPAAKPATPKRAAPAARRKQPKRRAAVAHQASRADKTECIADYVALKAKHGDKLTRRLFVDNAKTGRRYEKLWANSWPAFVKEAARGVTTGEKPATPAAAKPAAKPAASKTKKAAPAAKTKKNDKGPWTVKVQNAKGKTLGATIFEKKVGDSFAHSSGTYKVAAIDAEKREIYVETAGDKAPAPGEAKTQAPEAKKRPIPYAIQTADGKKHGATVTELKVGDKWGAAERWEVVAVDHVKREYTVKDLTAPAAAQPASAASAPAWPYPTSSAPPAEPKTEITETK